MKQRIYVSAAVCALLAVPTVAEAQDQPWLRDRKNAEGIGIRVGDFELHPAVGAEFGYDSNFFHRAPGENPIGTLRLRVTPALAISTLGAERGKARDFEFRSTVSLTYHEFFQVSGPTLRPADQAPQRNLSGDLSLSLGIMRGRAWSGTLNAGVSRAISPSSDAILQDSFNRVMPHAGAELAFAPGAGLFDWRLGYDFSGTFFESGKYTGLTNMQNQISTRGRWRFLPRTALLYEAKLGFINYTDSGPGGKTGSHPLRTLLGLGGLITPSLSVQALAGYGASFYTPAGQEDFSSVIGRLELKWFLGGRAAPEPGKPESAGVSSVALGFSRDFADSFIGTYYERDRGYLNLSYLFGGRFLAIVEAGAGPVIFPDITALSLPSFTDVRIDASLFGEFRFKDYLGLNATVKYGQNISGTSITSTETVAGTLVSGAPDELKWQQIEAYLGLRWFM